MSFSTNGTSAQQSEINVTPLIDVLLVLLIIFMVIVPITPSGLNTLLPQPPKSNTPQPPEPSTVVLEVRSAANGAPAYSLNQQPVAKQDLEGRLTQIFAVRQQRRIFLKGDAALEFSAVAEAISAAHKASITDIAVITPKLTETP